MSLVRSVFKDDHGEISFKKVMDVHEMAASLAEVGIYLDPAISESLGSLLLCLGDIEIDKGWGDRQPPDTEELRKAKQILSITIE